MIYGFAVITKQSIRLVKEKTPSTFISLNSLSKRPSIEVDDRDRQCLSTCNALLSTSWTINREVMPVFFGENCFEFSSSPVFRKFLKTVPRSCWSLIADITIGNFDRARYEDTQFIARRSPLGKIKVHFTCGSICSIYKSVQEAAEFVSIGKNPPQLTLLHERARARALRPPLEGTVQTPGHRSFILKGNCPKGHYPNNLYLGPTYDRCFRHRQLLEKCELMLFSHNAWGSSDSDYLSD